MKIDTLTVLGVEPEQPPYVKSIGDDLRSLQAEVGGSIEAIYPFDDPVAIICNEEGKSWDFHSIVPCEMRTIMCMMLLPGHFWLLDWVQKISAL